VGAGRRQLDRRLEQGGNVLPMVLDLAINGRAEALVTSNKKHFSGAGKRFGIPVLSPADLLEKIREGNQNGD
jgi:hypothetical protein